MFKISQTFANISGGILCLLIFQIGLIEDKDRAILSGMIEIYVVI
jgi:hypothetical protein